MYGFQVVAESGDRSRPVYNGIAAVRSTALMGPSSLGQRRFLALIQLVMGFMRAAAGTAADMQDRACMSDHQRPENQVQIGD